MQFLLLPMYIRLKHNNRYTPLKIAIKGSMTLIAVLFCGYGFLRIYREFGQINNVCFPSGFRTSPFILAGLVICMLADIVLVLYFPLGMLLFLIGHICYITCFLQIAPFNPVSIPVFAVASFITYRYFKRFSREMGKLKFGYIIYGLVILSTFSIAIMLPFSIGSYGVIPAISSVLLVISDIMLAVNKLAGHKHFSDLLYLGYYFTGQYFLALSIFIPVCLKI